MTQNRVRSTELSADNDGAAARAMEAVGIVTWEIDRANDTAIVRSTFHDRLFGHATPLRHWGFGVAAEQVLDEDRPAFLRSVGSAWQTGSLRCVTRIRWPDGSIHAIAFRGRVVAAQPGLPLRMVGTAEDAAEWMSGDARLQDLDVRLHLAQDIAAIGSFELDIQSGAIAWSDEILGVYGVDRSNFGGTFAEWRALVHPEDREKLRSSMLDAIARRASRQTLTFRIRRPDGEIRKIECLKSFTYALDGTPLRCVGVSRDTTEEARTARDLAESEARYRSMFDQAVVGVIESDLNGRFVRVNNRLAEMLGYASTQDLVGLTHAEITDPEDAAREADLAALLQAGHVPSFAHDVRLLRRDGSPIWVHSTSSLVRDTQTKRPAYRTSFVVDATERKQAEYALAAAEERLRLAQEAAGAGFWDLDTGRGVLTYSKSYGRLFGLDPDGPNQCAQEDWLMQMHPDDRDGVRKASAAALVTGVYEQEFRIVRPDGSVRWLAGRGRTHVDPAGRPLRMIGLSVDVTDVRENERRLRMAMEGTGFATWEYLNVRGDALWSANHFSLFGYEPEASGRATRAMWQDRVHPDDLPQILAAVEQARGRRQFRIVYRIRRADDGAERWMETLGCPTHRTGDVTLKHGVGITFDVTDREVSRARLQALQSELLHVSRVADAGVMASALAHELSQPLTAAASALQSAHLRLEGLAPGMPRHDGHDLRQVIGLANDQLARAGEIVTGLRNFVMPHPCVRQPEALMPLVEEARSLAMIGLGHAAISLTFDIPPRTPLILGDSVQIRQVLFNLLRNAFQAVMDHPPDASVRSVTVAAAARGREVEITVSDNGPGVDPAIAERLFKPFATSKADGMGIGLSICHSIIDAHGGRIEAHRNPGGGMAFRFTLPSADTAAEEGSAHGPWERAHRPVRPPRRGPGPRRTGACDRR